MIASHNTDLGISFYNDRVKEVIDAGIIAEPFTYVPPLAGHMELVGGNALVFGKITEGYDVIAADMTVEISYEPISSVVPLLYLTVKPYQTSEVINVDPVGPCFETRTLVGILVITLPSKIYEENTYFINVVKDDEGLDLGASYVANIGDTLADVKAGLQLAMTGAGMDVVAGSPSNQIWMYERNYTYCNDPYEKGTIDTAFDNFDAVAFISSYGFSSSFPQLKRGAVHSYGIVYKDRAGRTCSVIKTSVLDIYIPFYSEVEESLIETIIKIVFKVYHKPPDWAESYEIVYFGNISMDYFFQIRAEDITLIPNSNDNRFSVNIQNTLDWTRNQNNRWKVADYVWEDGDRMRLVATINDITGYGEAIGGGFVYDYEIEATGTQYDEEAIGGDWLIVQAVERPDPFAGEVNIIAEVYRPRKGLGQTVAYGTGMVFEIGVDAQGNKYHKGDVDQALDVDGACVTPAEINNTANDCWKLVRLNYKNNTSNIVYPFWAESIFPSDWWANQIVSNKLTSQGFPFLDDLSQRQAVLDERFRFGGALIEGTRTNNIAHFTYSNYRDLQKKNGDIIGLREIGYTLKAIQMYKETSIYINRVQTFNADGTSQFTLTDSFIGDIRPMETDFGCQHPNSIMVNGRDLYYWDNSQGAFIRSSPNGQIAISGPEYKMSRWFKDLSQWIRTSGGSEALVVNIGANNDFEEVWATFRMGDEIKGVIFSEKRGRYIAEIDQITESYIHLGNFFAHLYHQTLWIMNIDEGQGYLSWTGTPTYAEIEVVSNVETTKNKVFNAIGVIADHLLQSLARFVRIPIEASAVSELMETNVPVFNKREGVYFGKIMKDVNSKGSFTSDISRKLNGREMRGRYCFVKLRTTEHDEKVRIDSITVFSTPSERNI